MIRAVPKDVWLTALAVVVLLGGYAALVWYPAHRLERLYQTRADGAQGRLAAITATESELARLQQEVEELQALLDADDHVVPDSPQLSSFLRSLTESARSQGVLDQELTTGEFQRFRDFSVVPATLEFDAGFPAAYAVLEAIEGHRRLTAVNRTELRREGRGLRGGALQASMELVAYFTTERGVTP